MPAADEAVQELETMLDEGVSVALANPAANDYELRVRVEEGCEECLVPDEVMAQILTDALHRRGVAVDEVSVVHD